MLIGIDGNEANLENRVGVGQYAFNILHQLYQLDSQNSYKIFLKNPPLTDLPKPHKNWQYLVFGPGFAWTRLALPLKLLTQKLDLFYTPTHYLPPFGTKTMIATIHDIGYLQFQDQFTKKDFYQLKNWTASSIKKAVHLFAVSEFTKQEIVKTYHISPSIITVSPNGVGEPTKTDPTIFKKFNIKKPYFLALGTLKPNKNIPFLLQSFYDVVQKKPDYQLVIAGKKGWLFDDIFATVQKLKLTHQVIFTDFISESQKWTLLKQATALVIPSTYEGFGIPALEAMKVGTPIIASSIPPLAEVVGESGILIDPTKQSSLTQAMLKNLAKYKILGPKQAQNYTWPSSAKIILKLFQSFASQPSL